MSCMMVAHLGFSFFLLLLLFCGNEYLFPCKSHRLCRIHPQLRITHPIGGVKTMPSPKRHEAWPARLVAAGLKWGQSRMDGGPSFPLEAPPSDAPQGLPPQGLSTFEKVSARKRMPKYLYPRYMRWFPGTWPMLAWRQTPVCLFRGEESKDSKNKEAKVGLWPISVASIWNTIIAHAPILACTVAHRQLLVAAHPCRRLLLFLCCSYCCSYCC